MLINSKLPESPPPLRNAIAGPSVAAEVTVDHESVLHLKTKGDRRAVDDIELPRYSR